MKPPGTSRCSRLTSMLLVVTCRHLELPSGCPQPWGSTGSWGGTAPCSEWAASLPSAHDTAEKRQQDTGKQPWTLLFNPNYLLKAWKCCLIFFWSCQAWGKNVSLKKKKKKVTVQWLQWGHLKTLSQMLHSKFSPISTFDKLHLRWDAAVELCHDLS